MSTKSVSVNLRPDILDALAERGQRAPTINRDLERLYSLYDRALRRLELTVDEACLIVDSLNGTIHDVWSAARFWIGVQDSIELDGLDEKWKVDGKALIAKLSELDETSCMAIVDAVERFWQNENYHKDVRAGVTKVFKMGKEGD